MSIKSEHPEQIQETEADIGEQLAISPGRLLREAREQQMMSQEQVASRLNLRLTLVQDIEQDHFPAHMAETFIRGYLRSYCKLLGIEEAQVLASYEQLGTGKAQTGMHSFSKRTHKEASDSRLKWVTRLIILVLIILLIAWWWQESMTKSSVEPVPQPATATQSATTPAQPASEPAVSPAGSQEQSPASVDTHSTPSVADESSSTHVSPTETSTAATESAAAETQNQQQGLVLSFRGDCWVKVTDGTGKQLVVGIKKQGDTLELEGQPPFHLILGAPQLVDVSYQGKHVSLDAFKNSIAKLIVPEQQ
ncbi:RodZ domain-containing protein [Dongshaea marina]|uniref:RodZ domain-containing protein n=1 Tax=Dongshaea marina TaxID=2047966 RepID=UPI000D3E932F|nr:RodZ domain-containing protein [Dongshaea marina]